MILLPSMKIPLGATRKPPKYLVNVSTLQYSRQSRLKGLIREKKTRRRI
jgi:hypothetical protein